MDPFTLVVSIANLIALTDNLYRGVKYFREAFNDPRADDLYVRLLTERARFAEWKNKMGIESGGDLDKLFEKLSDSNQEALSAMLRPLVKYTRYAEEIADRYAVGRFHERGEKLLFKDRLRRLNFRFQGADELAQMLQTLKSCNDGLLTIAPPPPGYYSSLQNNDAVIIQSESDPVTSLRRIPPLRSEVTSQNEQTTAGASQNASNQFSKSKSMVYRPLIDLLYSTCMDSLKTLVLRFPGQRTRFEAIGDRLSTWGSGLFRFRVTIDQALNRRSEAVSMLRNNVCGTLVDFLLVLGEFFLHRAQPVILLSARNISLSQR